MLGPLTHPPAYGGDAADAFTVVARSLRGYGWSGTTRQRGWDIRRVARALEALMAGLGYERYGAQGGDRGAIATGHLGVLDADHLIGLHLNMANAPRPRDVDDESLTEEERRDLAEMREFRRRRPATRRSRGRSPRPSLRAQQLTPGSRRLDRREAPDLERLRRRSRVRDLTGRPADQPDRLLGDRHRGLLGAAVLRDLLSRRAGPADRARRRADRGRALPPRDLPAPRSWVEEGFDWHYRRKSSDSPTHSSGCTGQNGGSRRGCSPSQGVLDAEVPAGHQDLAPSLT